MHGPKGVRDCTFEKVVLDLHTGHVPQISQLTWQSALRTKKKTGVSLALKLSSVHAFEIGLNIV